MINGTRLHIFIGSSEMKYKRKRKYKYEQMSTMDHFLSVDQNEI